MTDHISKIGVVELGIQDINTLLMVQNLNSIQDVYNFSYICKIEVEREEENLNRREILSIVRNKVNVDEYDLLFVIHGYPDDDNYFATNPFEKISLCTTFGWKNISEKINVIYSIASSIIQIIQSCEIYKDDPKKTTQEYLDLLYIEAYGNKNTNLELFHLEAIGCLNDFCANRKEKIFRIRTGDLCDDCASIWEQKLPPEQIEALFEMIENVRINAILNKSIIKTRAYCRNLVICIEKTLHKLILDELKKKYNETWWTDGISNDLRIKIASNYEQNNCVGVKEDYTYLLDLLNIWLRKSNYTWLKQIPPFCNFPNNKKTVKSDMQKINLIRNKLMHPTRKYIPSESDKQLLEKFTSILFT